MFVWNVGNLLLIQKLNGAMVALGEWLKEVCSPPDARGRKKHRRGALTHGKDEHRARLSQSPTRASRNSSLQRNGTVSLSNTNSRGTRVNTLRSSAKGGSSSRSRSVSRSTSFSRSKSPRKSGYTSLDEDSSPQEAGTAYSMSDTESYSVRSTPATRTTTISRGTRRYLARASKHYRGSGTDMLMSWSNGTNDNDHDNNSVSSANTSPPLLGAAAANNMSSKKKGSSATARKSNNVGASSVRSNIHSSSRSVGSTRTGRTLPPRSSPHGLVIGPNPAGSAEETTNSSSYMQRQYEFQRRERTQGPFSASRSVASDATTRKQQDLYLPIKKSRNPYKPPESIDALSTAGSVQTTPARLAIENGSNAAGSKARTSLRGLVIGTPPPSRSGTTAAAPAAASTSGRYNRGASTSPRRTRHHSEGSRALKSFEPSVDDGVRLPPPGTTTSRSYSSSSSKSNSRSSTGPLLRMGSRRSVSKNRDSSAPPPIPPMAKYAWSFDISNHVCQYPDSRSIDWHRNTPGS